MGRDEQRQAAFDTWEAMAAGWERWRPAVEATSTPVREWLLRELAPQPGDTILELAAGPGDTGFAAAAAVGDTGRLISTDLSPAMVEVGRRRAAELGLRNVEHRAMDAEQIELEDDSVDGVLCRFGYMLMPDPAAALAETRRVLRKGGRLALAVWRGAEQNPWISIAGRILVERGLFPRPEPGAPGIFALANDERLRDLLEGAGFAVERMEDVPVRFTYRDVDDYVVRATDMGGGFATVWRQAPQQERAAIKAQLAEAFAPYDVDGGYELPGVAVCAPRAEREPRAARRRRRTPARGLPPIPRPPPHRAARARGRGSARGAIPRSRRERHAERLVQRLDRAGETQRPLRVAAARRRHRHALHLEPRLDDVARAGVPRAGSPDIASRPPRCRRGSARSRRGSGMRSARYAGRRPPSRAGLVTSPPRARSRPARRASAPRPRARGSLPQRRRAAGGARGSARMPRARRCRSRRRR